MRKQEREITEGLDRSRITIASYPGAKEEDIKRLVEKGVIQKEEMYIITHVDKDKSQRWEGKEWIRKEWEDLIRVIRNKGNQKISVCPMPARDWGEKYVNETIRLKNEIVAGVYKTEGIKFLLAEGKGMGGFLNALISERIHPPLKKKQKKQWVLVRGRRRK